MGQNEKTDDQEEKPDNLLHSQPPLLIIMKEKRRNGTPEAGALPRLLRVSPATVFTGVSALLRAQFLQFFFRLVGVLKIDKLLMIRLKPRV
jgi:hypothetical protein